MTATIRTKRKQICFWRPTVGSMSSSSTSTPVVIVVDGGIGGRRRLLLSKFSCCSTKTNNNNQTVNNNNKAFHHQSRKCDFGNKEIRRFLETKFSFKLKLLKLKFSGIEQTMSGTSSVFWLVLLLLLLL